MGSYVWKETDLNLRSAGATPAVVWRTFLTEVAFFPKSRAWESSKVTSTWQCHNIRLAVGLEIPPFPGVLGLGELRHCAVWDTMRPFVPVPCVSPPPQIMGQGFICAGGVRLLCARSPGSGIHMLSEYEGLSVVCCH